MCHFLEQTSKHGTRPKYKSYSTEIWQSSCFYRELRKTAATSENRHFFAISLRIRHF